MKPEDSGLQTAMRALLGIIAGLLIADMLKNVVNTFRYSTPANGVPNVLLVVAAALFLFRVVVDNILFYELRDRTSDAYFRRVLLLGMDLTSYAICYFIVAELEPQNTKEWTTFVSGVTRVTGGIAGVEFLHALWCGFWLWALRDIRDMPDEEKTDRRDRLLRWGKLSGVLFLIATVLAVCFGMCSPRYHLATAMLAGYSIISVVLYLTMMRKDYTGTAKTWANELTSPPTPSAPA